MTKCLICGSADRVPVYVGPIREGRFGELSSESCRISGCRACGARCLEDRHGETKTYYESDAYRESVDGAGDVRSYFTNHDAEQLKHLTATGTGALRGKVIADVGCGAGSFLHCVEGMARTIVAIEPSQTFRPALEGRGYLTFPYVADALARLRGEIDLAVSFSVIEHVERPDEFLQEIHELLRPREGRLVISTPNADDGLLTALPAEYPQFFYRRAHLWYWTAGALRNLLLQSGFTDVVVSPFQRFGIGNFLGWLRDRAPQGEKTFGVATSALDAVWKAELERLGVADYLFASARARGSLQP